jgi:IS30 family transposase
MRKIAASIQRALSTVSREVGRHHGRASYRAAEADQRAWDAHVARNPIGYASAPPLGRRFFVAAGTRDRMWRHSGPS